MADAASGKRKILVVEDEIVISNICCIVLEAEGFDVNTAPDCRTAQKMIDETEFDLCLIDLMMPEMNGMQLYQWMLETHPELADKAIFSTGSIIEIEETVKDFLQKSGRPILLKPFSLDELVNIIWETSQ